MGGAFLGRVSARAFAGAFVASVGWLGACDGQSEQPTAMTAVERCLADAGLEVRAAKPGADDEDAPDRGELIAAGAFVAFYSSAGRAEDLAAVVRRAAAQGRGEVARYDDVTVVYLPNAKRDTIENCVQTNQ